jgi:hypothetical protein
MRLMRFDSELLDEVSGIAGVDANLRRNAAVRFTNRQAFGQNHFDGFPRVLAHALLSSPDRSYLKPLGQQGPVHVRRPSVPRR